MLEFEEIKEIKPEDELIKIEEIGGHKSITRTFRLNYTDEELKGESIPKLQEKLNLVEKEFDQHPFSFDQLIISLVFFDELYGENKIELDVIYYYPESRVDTEIPDIETVEKLYRPVFEEFYKKNKPY